MRISSIQTYRNAPVFTAVNYKKYATPINVSQKIDTFEKAVPEYDFSSGVEAFHSKLSDMMGVVSPEDVEQMAKSVSKRTGIDKLTVYSVMNTLSTYSSYKSLSGLKEQFQQIGLNTVSKLPTLYNENNKNLPICLTSALNYIFVKNLGFEEEAYDNSGKAPKAVIVDSNLIKILKNMPLSEREDFYENYLNKDETKLIYIENFENGYNFLNQAQDFEEMTVDVINKAKSYQEFNGKSLDYNVKYVLNGEHIKGLKELGLKPYIIRADAGKNPDAETIAENLNPIIPSADEIKDVIKEIESNLSQEESMSGKKYVMDFLNTMMFAVSPKRYSMYLKNIHEQLADYLAKNNKTFDNVHFLIPSVDKSFILTNYQYQKVNEIHNPKNVFANKNIWGQGYFDVLSLPERSVLVALDDCIISGLSMAKDVLPYNDISRLISSKHKDMSVVLASVFATQSGIDNIQKVLRLRDKILVAETLPTWSQYNGLADKKYLGLEYPQTYLTSFVFPYMGPDTNCRALVPLYEKFLFSPEAQKIIVDNLDFIYCAIF